MPADNGDFGCYWSSTLNFYWDDYDGVAYALMFVDNGNRDFYNSDVDGDWCVRLVQNQ